GCKRQRQAFTNTNGHGPKSLSIRRQRTDSSRKSIIGAPKTINWRMSRIVRINRLTLADMGQRRLDYSGSWAHEVGIPVKSGVGGGILGVVNRQLGVGTYSPQLDRNGNSVRGIASFKMMSDSLGLHTFDLTNTGSA